MNKNDPLAGALQSFDTALSTARTIGDLPDCRANSEVRAHVQRLLGELEKTRIQILAASDLMADQAAHIEQLSVVGLNSTVRGF